MITYKKSRATRICHDILFASVLLICFSSIVSAESGSIAAGDTLEADIGNNIFISVPGLFNFTNFTVTTGQLQFYLNNSQLQWRTNTNKTLTNIKFNSVTDNFTFTISGTAGYLNFSATMINASSSYNLMADGIFVESRYTTSEGKVWFNYTGDATLSITVSNGNVTATTTWWNSITNDDSTVVHVQGTESIEFGLSNSEMTTAVWTLDDTIQSETSPNFTTNLNSLGVYSLSAYGNIPTGTTQTVTWKLLSVREKSGISDQVVELNETWFDNLVNSMNGSSPDFTQFFSALTLPYTSAMGNLFFVFIYLLPMAIIWIRQEKAIIPVGLGIIFGGLLIPTLPEAWQGAAIIFIILTTVGVLYSLFKERG